MKSNRRRLEFSRVPRSFADFLRQMAKFLEFGLGEQQATVFPGQLAVPRLRLAGQQTLLVTVAEDVGDDCLDVLRLRAALGVIVAFERVGMDDLEIKRRGALLLRIAERRAADLRKSAADVSGIKFVNQTKAVALVLAERQ